MRSVRGSQFTRVIASAVMALIFIGAAPAEARGGRDRDRPGQCANDHDHRSHAANYYDYYAPDRYYRAGAYRGGGVTVTIGDPRAVNNGRGYYSDRGFNDRRGYVDPRARRGSEVVYRDVIPARGAARIIVTEEIVYGRRGAVRVCTVEAVGRDAWDISNRRLRQIAQRNCSRQASIRIRA